MRCLSLSGLCWAKKTGIFILGTLTIMTVGQRRFLAFFSGGYVKELTFSKIKNNHLIAMAISVTVTSIKIPVFFAQRRPERDRHHI